MFSFSSSKSMIVADGGGVVFESVWLVWAPSLSLISGEQIDCTRST